VTCVSQDNVRFSSAFVSNLLSNSFGAPEIFRFHACAVAWLDWVSGRSDPAAKLEFPERERNQNQNLTSLHLTPFTNPLLVIAEPPPWMTYTMSK